MSCHVLSYHVISCHPVLSCSVLSFHVVCPALSCPVLSPSSPYSTSTTQGPGSDGWVELIENGITFGFDLTRVMFCSGNCTERMRMGREAVRGQVVVDLYCGVGYYTLPFLVHGQV